MAVLLSDGFELTDDKTFAFAKWTGKQLGAGLEGHCDYVTVNQHHGAKCLDAWLDTGLAGNSKWANIYKSISYNPCHIREYVEVNTITDGALGITQIMAFSQDAGQTFAIYGGMQNNGGIPRWHLRYQNAGVFTTLTGPNCSLNKAYCVELAAYRVDASATGWAKMWVDGKLILSVDSININRTLSFASVGHCYSNQSTVANQHLYIDCVVIANQYIGLERPIFSSRSHRSLRMKRGKSGRAGRLYLK